MKQLVASSLQTQEATVQAQVRHEQAVALQQQAVAVQQETNFRMAAQLEELQKSVQARMDAQEKSIQGIVAASNPASGRAGRFLQKMTAHDDVEAYLAIFERIAEREGWPQDQWAGIVAPFLAGDPQKAYFDLPAAEAKDYDLLKAEIMARLGVTTAVLAHRMHTWKFRTGQSPRGQMHELLLLAKKWLQPEKLSAQQVVERVVLDRYLRALPEELQQWVSLGDPQSPDLLVEMVERYQVTAETCGTGRFQRTKATQKMRLVETPGKRGWRNPGTSPQDNQGTIASMSESSALSQRVENILCWHCHNRGHVQAQCPLRDEPMDCGAVHGVSYYSQSTCIAHLDLTEGRFECDVWVNHSPARALLDSGSMVTLVHPRVMEKVSPTRRTLTVVCIHGDTRKYPLIPVTLTTACGLVTQEVGVVPRLINDIIVGRDCPPFF